MAVEVLSSPVLAPAVCSLRRAAGRGLPGGNSLFFCFAKRKVSKRKGDPAVCDPSLRYGQPAVLGPGGVSLELASLRQSRSLIRLNLRSSAQTEGGGERNTKTEYPNCQRQNPEDHKKQGLAVASPCWYLSFVFGLQSPLPIGPCGCAEERRARRIRAKTCLSRRRVVFDPGWTEHRRLPEAKRRDAGTRVAFSLVTFFWRSKRKLLACRATPGQQFTAMSAGTEARTNPRNALPYGDSSCSK